MVHYLHTLFADPNAEIARDLARIADALSKGTPSPWLEWTRNLSSFVAGIATAFLSIEVQARLGDKRERRKMRRIVYVELAKSFVELYEWVWNLKMVYGQKPRQPNAQGEIHPPAVHILNPGFTFDGLEYMRQHSSVCYELPEREELKRMYEELRRLAPGTEPSIGDLQVPLVHFAEMYRRSKVMRDSFHRFAHNSGKQIAAIANRFGDYRIPTEDLVILVPHKTGTVPS